MFCLQYSTITNKNKNKIGFTVPVVATLQLECNGTGATTASGGAQPPVSSRNEVYFCFVRLAMKKLHGDKRKIVHTTERVLFSIFRPAESALLGSWGVLFRRGS